MNASHHIPENLLNAYANGLLPEAFSLLVACHVSMCDQCRADVAAFEAVGGALLDDHDQVDLSNDALAATLAMIERPETAPIAAPGSVTKGSVFPAPLQDYAGTDPAATRWRSVGGGVKQAVLKTDGAATARLLYIPAGKAVPDHSHNGLELTLVLQGSFSDHVSRFGRGDVEVGDDDLDHQPVADAGDDCICLAVTEAPLKFRGLIPRIFQPFIGI